MREFQLMFERKNLLRQNNQSQMELNTPVVIMDEDNQAHLPLVVQYPIEKYGNLKKWLITLLHTSVIVNGSWCRKTLR